MEFNPAIVPFSRLLDVFWSPAAPHARIQHRCREHHDPTACTAEVLCESAEQRRQFDQHVVLVSQGKYVGRRMRAVASPLKNFELADESQQVCHHPASQRSLTTVHQKYYQKRRGGCVDAGVLRRMTSCRSPVNSLTLMTSSPTNVVVPAFWSISKLFSLSLQGFLGL